MIYRLFYYLIKFTCYFYFKKTRVYHPENLDLQNPVIICANHGNSFMDAILIAINSKRTLHFLVRADVFDTPFKRWFFSQLNMMPIYRIRDGREAIKNNDSIFLKCRKVLENNGAIVIFPEGNCIVEKRLRAFKTGFVHLAFNTPVQNLQVLPVALNYSRPDEFYSDASLHFLPPVDIVQLKEETENQEFEFNKLLMKKTHDALLQNMVYISSREDDEFYEAILLMKRNSSDLKKSEFITSQIEAIDKVKQIHQTSTISFEDLKQNVFAYFDKLNARSLDDKTIVTKPISTFKICWMFPFYFSGYLLNILPSSLLENIVENKIKEKQFKSSVRMVLSLFIYSLYILVVAFLLDIVFGNYAFALFMITGLMFCYYKSFAVFNIIKQQNTPKTNLQEIENLKLLRSEITKSLNL